MRAWNIPQIYVEKEGVFWLPIEVIKKGEKWIKHVNCNWSRRHVISYYLDSNGKVRVKCNEPNCIINATVEEIKKLFEPQEVE